MCQQMAQPFLHVLIKSVAGKLPNTLSKAAHKAQRFQVGRGALRCRGAAGKAPSAGQARAPTRCRKPQIGSELRT